MTEGDHGGLHAHITKKKRILFDNAAINNKWETNHTFDVLQKFYLIIYAIMCLVLQLLKSTRMCN